MTLPTVRPTRQALASDRGFAASRPTEPCVLVIFGAGGDLTRRQLIPSLYELACKDLLPDRFAVIGFSRSQRGDEAFRDEMRSVVEDECRFDEGVWERFRSIMFWVTGEFHDPPDGSYRALADCIASIREARGIPDNVFFHLAAPPSFFGTIVQRLAESGLAHGGSGWRRLVVEKPFGEDRASAIALDAEIRSVFDEDRVYRIDHFLGKETVQNMLVFRFANPSFEPIWNRNHVDHVQITVAEEVGVGSRGSFYESTGVVRDMVQNHLLQLLCMTAVEPPVSFESESLRNETVKVLEAVQVTPFDPARDAVAGQYGRGTIGGKDVRAYRDEDRVAADSKTPTFAALRLTLDNWRWAGVPFYLRTGKRLARKLTEVSVHFRPTPHFMFASAEQDGLSSNVLTFRLQPEEGIYQQFLAKQPGPDVVVRPVTMHFGYGEAFGIEEPPRAYAWLLLDVMQGDQRLFARADWIQEAWSILDRLVAHWDDETREIPMYEAGSWGPPEAHHLLERDGRSWGRLP